MGNLASDCVIYPVSSPESENKVVQQQASLVKRIAQHLLGKLPPCVQLEDLIQAGMIGLLEAAKNYDVSKGASFETYASIRIRGSMLDEIRKGDWVPRSVHRNSRKIAQAIKMVENKTGRDPRNFEVAESLNMTLNEYHQLIQETSTARIIAFQDMGLSEEVIAEGISITSPGPLDGLQQEDFKKNLLKSIESLPERERLVLALYYDQELNLREVGEVLGVSESRVSQIHSQAMLRLQTRLKE